MKAGVGKREACLFCLCVGIFGQVLMAGEGAAQPCPKEPPQALRITMPSRMINSKSITIQAELLDNLGRTDWRQWDLTGAVVATRWPSGDIVPLSRVNFDTHEGTPPPQSIRIRSGLGCVTMVLENGVLEPGGEVLFTVTVGGFVDGELFTVADSKLITILDNPTFKNISGVLSGDNLTWRPGDGVIHITGNASVGTGSTLTIEPGTLIMVDAGPAADGTRIDVTGRIQAAGTQDDPIFFFPTAGAPALRLMEDCPGPASNVDAWRGIFHTGGGTSIYDHVILTGAGNGIVAGHAKPPVLRFQGSHSFVLSNSIMASNNGKVIHGQGSGSYTITKSLITQCGHGGEFTGTGNYSLLVENTWYISVGLGEAEGEEGGEPVECSYDGDCMNIGTSNPGLSGSKHVRGCIFTDSGDDGIDIRYTAPLIENCIFWHMIDKGVSMEGGGDMPRLENLLIFDVHFATDGHHLADPEIPGTAFAMVNCTLDAPETVRALQRTTPGTTIDKTIIWPNPQPTCEEPLLNYCIVGLGSDLRCGIGNMAIDPMIVSREERDYQLQPNSPAHVLGPDGEQIGWLGFNQPMCPCAGVLDLDKFAEFADCIAGPDGGLDTLCECYDYDRDSDVDLMDFQSFQEQFLQVVK